MHKSSGIFVRISSRACTGTADSNAHDDGSGRGTGVKESPLLRRPRSLWFSCLYASAGILLHKLNDHRRQGDKEDDTDDAKEFSTDHSGHKGVQRRKSHGFSHHPGVDELVFNKLYGKVNNEAADGQNGIHQQHEEHADYAGDQRSNVRDDGANSSQ